MKIEMKGLFFFLCVFEVVIPLTTCDVKKNEKG